MPPRLWQYLGVIGSRYIEYIIVIVMAVLYIGVRVPHTLLAGNWRWWYVWCKNDMVHDNIMTWYMTIITCTIRQCYDS
jgi:hypothetical protein